LKSKPQGASNPAMRYINESCGAGFSLWGFDLAGTEIHRLNPVPQKS
jgi:hypothetical protein